MRTGGIKFLWATFAIAVVLVLTNVFALHAARIQYAPFAVQRASWYDALGQFHEWLGYVVAWRSLTGENQDLKSRLAKAEASQASLEALRSQNDFYRKALDIKNAFNRTPIPGGLYNVSLSPSGYVALVNRGTQDGVAVGDIVASPDGVLIGSIREAFSSSSRVMLTTDPAFKATVRVLGGQTSGLAHGALGAGMVLDLIVQSDSITEKDTLVTTGADRTPAGLVVGTVANVKVNDTQLFKSVTIAPAADLSKGQVLILKP